MLPYVSHRLLKSFKFFLACSLALFFFLTYSVTFGPDIAGPRYPPQQVPDYVCPAYESGYVPFIYKSSFSDEERSLTENRVLILVESIYSRHGKLITQLLNATKYLYKVETFSKNLPLLTTSARGRFSAIIIENYYKYLNLPRWNRQLLDKYCRDYKAPLVAFINSKPESFPRVRVKGFNLTLWQNQKARNLSISNGSEVPFLSRTNVVLPQPRKDAADWVLFEEHVSYETVLSAEDAEGRKRTAVIRDKGLEDGVNRILFGYNISEWLVKMAFIDSLRFATKGRFGFSLDRFIQIDIDDIFVGSRGTRIVPDDVQAIIQSQHELRRSITNFTYCMGFSGSYFHHGDDQEDSGDDTIIEKAAEFVWFPHMWRHNHAQELNESFLESIMLQNKLFAQSVNLPVHFPYAISPQHAGVYPVHEALYLAWKKVWNVSVTATEEYPHLRPPSQRRGFIHEDVMVLPRQTCGLYTHTQFFHLYPEGMQRLVHSIQGGDLFFTILLNPVSVFMTHQQNFAHDRLALYTFRNLVKFLKCWTNLELHWEKPIDLARRYFALFPQERSPVWNNPCTDERHRAILPLSINCSNLTLPNLLIVGPQKTGTTALSKFLTLHPDVSTNPLLPDSFEEVQFFSGAMYKKGVEWYSSLFRPAAVVVDKSANYFDSAEAAKRAKALLPDAFILVILHDPSLRAYSWFHHLKAKNESSVALFSSMDELLDSDSPVAIKVRKRTITGGRYAHHLERWLEHFGLSQLILVDGSVLREQPAAVVTEVARRLGLPAFSFNERIVFVPKKNFFCTVTEGKVSCLGASKGRSYPTLSAALSTRLCSLFRPENVALQKLLVKHRLQIPSWLPASLTAC